MQGGEGGLQNMKNSKWKMVIQILISILTALGTTLGTTSCMGHGPIYF